MYHENMDKAERIVCRLDEKKKVEVEVFTFPDDENNGFHGQ